MPLPFILGGLALAAAGYGVKKGLDAKNANDEAKDLFKKVEELLEETKKRVELAQSDCENAFARFGEKKLHVISRGVSRFVEHFNQLKGHEFVINNMDMQNIQDQVSEALKVVNECKEMGLSDFASLGGVGAAVGVLATYGAYTGISAAAGGTVLSSISGTIAWMTGGAISLGGGLAAGSMALIGGVGAAPVIAILGALSAKKTKKKLGGVKACCYKVEERLTEACGVIDKLLAIERVVKLFTRQITKCDALFFSLSQDAIATMKKHNYNRSLYSQEERDQLCVTVSTLMTLSAFLKVPIIDKDQKLQEKAKRALEIMKGQMDALESGRYNVAMIQSRQKDLENL
ncbi:glycine zipper family protein [Helicobacter pylori]|uniref:glycine zipper family protein n=1 Tax=Helicobacter pylori TaxID=210 RepID=UPI00165A39CB|nr:glycine zipper family protein [Helicobacter pylori]WQS13932.1 glycine zipper family protein [Helicobacter pylori]WQS23673.1 glycine zipper family protein [Helicobacter pylori]